jgi:hypothetical protein
MLWFRDKSGLMSNDIKLLNLKMHPNPDIKARVYMDAAVGVYLLPYRKEKEVGGLHACASLFCSASEFSALTYIASSPLLSPHSCSSMATAAACRTWRRFGSGRL